MTEYEKRMIAKEVMIQMGPVPLQSGLTYRELQIFAKEILKGLGLLPTQINQAEAYRRYSRSRVDQLEKLGYLHPVKDTETGSKYYNVAELEEIMAQNNVLEKFKLRTKSKKL